MSDQRFSNDTILEIIITVFVFFVMAALAFKILFL